MEIFDAAIDFSKQLQILSKSKLTAVKIALNLDNFVHKLTLKMLSIYIKFNFKFTSNFDAEISLANNDWLANQWGSQNMGNLSSI